MPTSTSTAPTSTTPFTQVTLPLPAQPETPPRPKRTMTYNQLSSCPDMEPAFLPIYEAARPYTMTSLERLYGLYKAVQHIVSARIPGDIVECGVWKGGSTMAAALSLMQFGDTSRTLWLYDTFEGMPPPGPDDIQYDDLSADERAQRDRITDWSDVAAAGTAEVARNLTTTRYPSQRLRLIKGRVEQTIPGTLPAQIALLRLDTDWYESTRHEMQHLYPRLAPGGILIIDDYGHWKGARKAVDEYLESNRIPLFLSRLDYTCRIGFKPV